MNEQVGKVEAEAVSDGRYERLLDGLSRRLNARNFSLWFKEMRLESWRDGLLRMCAPNRFTKEWIEGNYIVQIAEEAAAIDDAPVRVVVAVAMDVRPSAATNGTPVEPTAGTANPADRVAEIALFAPAKSPADRPSAPVRRPAEPNDVFDTTPLNPHYTFDAFVTGPSNEMAYASARGVADDPGANYNPLFIHGNVGLGKTHLLHAIANEFRQSFPDERMCVLSCEEFTNEFIAALQHNQVDAFRERLRNVRLLIVDDIHFLAKKERTQEEFFNTFNRLHQLGCQIVLSSDAAPGDIPALTERLISRFTWGLVACLEQPETETRMAILGRKALQFGIELPPDVVEFVATNFRNNIRELEGAVQSIKARADIEGGAVDLALAERALAGRIRRPERRVDLDTIIAAVSDLYQIDAAVLKSRARTRNVSQPRQVAMYLARELTSLSLSEIGAGFGGRDHTTVMFALRVTEDRLKQDTSLAGTIARLKDRLGAR